MVETRLRDRAPRSSSRRSPTVRTLSASREDSQAHAGDWKAETPAAFEPSSTGEGFGSGDGGRLAGLTHLALTRLIPEAEEGGSRWTFGGLRSWADSVRVGSRDWFFSGEGEMVAGYASGGVAGSESSVGAGGD